MKLKHLIIPAFFLFGCNEDEEIDPVVITTSDFTATIDEDPTEGQSLGKVSGSASEGEVTFSLTSQDPEGALSIDTSSGELKIKDVLAFDFDVRSEVTGVVTVSSGSVSEEAKVTITITDVPVEVTTTDFTASVDENPEEGLSLGNVTASASEGSVTYSLTSQEVEDALTINASTGELKINDASVFDFEVRTSLTAMVTVTGGSDSKEAEITITINNVTEVTAADFSSSIDENPTNGQSVGTISGSTDTGSLTFSINSQSPSGALAIDEDTGELTVADESLFDFETYTEISATVLVKSGDVTEEVDVTLTIQDIPGTWQTVGEAGFTGWASDIDMVFDYNGTPYVVYQDLNNYGYITCKKFDGTSWVVVGREGFSGSQAQSMKITINNGTPYVVYISGSLRWPQVEKFDGTNWVDVGTYLTTNSSGHPDIAFDNDTPYVVYSDESNSSKNTVKKFDGTNWVVVGAEGFSDGLTLYNSMVIDNGTPYVAYYDASDAGKATVMKFDGSNWTAVGNKTFTSGAAQHTSLVIDDGTPYLAFTDGSQLSKATLMKFNGTDWTALGTEGFSGGTAFHTNLAVMRGTPYVVFQDASNSKKATLMKYDGSNWVNVGDAGFSAGEVIHTTLAFDNGIPYVAYRDGANGNKTTVMKFAE